MIARLLAPVAMPLLGALFAALVGLGGWAWLQSGWLEDAKAENDRLRNNLAACAARYSSLIRDKDRDDEIDRMPDLRDVPDSWLLPGPD